MSLEYLNTCTSTTSSYVLKYLSLLTLLLVVIQTKLRNCLIVNIYITFANPRSSEFSGIVSVLLSSCVFWSTHPELAKEVIQISSAFTGSSSSFLCQLQKAWVEFTIFSSPWPKLASRNSDHFGCGFIYLSTNYVRIHPATMTEKQISGCIHDDKPQYSFFSHNKRFREQISVGCFWLWNLLMS